MAGAVNWSERRRKHWIIKSLQQRWSDQLVTDDSFCLWSLSVFVNLDFIAIPKKTRHSRKAIKKQRWVWVTDMKARMKASRDEKLQSSGLALLGSFLRSADKRGHHVHFSVMMLHRFGHLSQCFKQLPPAAMWSWQRNKVGHRDLRLQLKSRIFFGVKVLHRWIIYHGAAPVKTMQVEPHPTSRAWKNANFNICLYNIIYI